FSSRRRHTRWPRDWSSDVCSSDLTSFVGRASLNAKLRRAALGVKLLFAAEDRPQSDRRCNKRCAEGDEIAPFVEEQRAGGEHDRDRKSVVKGKSVDLGGRQIAEKE